MAKYLKVEVLNDAYIDACVALIDQHPECDFVLEHIRDFYNMCDGCFFE